MGWQEELRRLDVELANGSIDHHRHRKLREELLAGASGGTAPSPVASPLRLNAGQRQAGQRTNPGLIGQQPQQPPAQPAEPQSTTPQPAPPPPVTSFSPPPAPKPAPVFETDRQTTAPSPADERPTDFVPYPKPSQSRIDAPTVVRPAVLPPPPRPEPVFLAQPPQRLQAMRQPESYEPPKDRRWPVWLFVTLGVVLVAALIAGGMWWMSGRNKGEVAAAKPTATGTAPNGAATSTTPKLVVIPPLPALPGAPNPNSSTMSVAKGQQGNLYSVQAADLFTRNGATDLALKASTEGSRGYLVLVVPTSSPDAAKGVVDYLYKNAIDSGFSEVKSDQRAAAGTDGKTRWNDSWYVSGDMAVSVAISQPASADKSVLKSRLDETVKSLQKVLPPR
jgi:hypothetical protein